MGRKKAQPKSNAERQEEERKRKLAELEPPQETEPEFTALDAWEEAEAYVSKPPRKISKTEQDEKKRNLPYDAYLREIEQETQHWGVFEIEVTVLGFESAALAANKASLLQAQEIGLAFSKYGRFDNSKVEIYSVVSNTERNNNRVRPIAEIQFPDADVTSQFEQLLSNAIALGPFFDVKGENKVMCVVGVSEKGMEGGSAAFAEDQRRWRHGPIFLNFLKCLMAQGDHLDPEYVGVDDEEDEIEVENAEVVEVEESAEEVENDDVEMPPPTFDVETPPPTFDASEIYGAVKPTGNELELSMDLPQLKPTLRGYQKRAVQWMINRELADGGEETSLLHPLWRQVRCLGDDRRTSSTTRCFYINIYNGLLSEHPFSTPPFSKGGIASDEMGLGKTVEILALVLGNRYKGPKPTFADTTTTTTTTASRKSAAAGAKEPEEERIDCVCGAFHLDPTTGSEYEGLWVQCSTCLAWQHGACVGFGNARRPPKDDFYCQPCLRARAAVQVTQPCGTTLVVCPTPILAQWRDEIDCHLVPGVLKVITYEGQPQPGAGRARQQPKLVTAEDLAAADIVLTTYDVLRGDLNHQPNVGEEEDAAAGGVASGLRRRRRKYEVMPTPLTRLHFWRVAIDEAQLVESSTAKATAMALKLQTKHRWCVTGTPLSRGLEDLQGLMAFLKVEPYASRLWWRKLIQEPYEEGSSAARARLMMLLRPAVGGLLWRSSKADVKEELGIPPQHHHLTNLDFSAIERHFYGRQHQDCVGTVSSALSPEILSAAAAAHASSAVILLDEHGNIVHESTTTVTARVDFDFQDRPLTQREEQRLLHPLLRLRQACVHPQVGAGGIKSLSATAKPMTMSEVLETLLTKARIEAEDAQRALLASTNGLAGLLLLQGLVSEAVRAYRQALSVIQSNKGQVRADKLQQLHTLHNLAVVLATPECQNDASVARTLRDSTLADEAASLRDEYLAEAVARLSQAESELQEVRGDAAQIKNEFSKVAGKKQAQELMEKWYIDGVHLIMQHAADGGSHALQQIREQLAADNTYREGTLKNASTWANKQFRDLMGLQFVMRKELEELRKAQSTTLSSYERLSREVITPSPELVHLAASCHRCRGDFAATAGSVCRHCRLDEQLVNYEVHLFTVITTAMEAGEAVSLEDAAKKAYNQSLTRAGRGGLGEGAGLSTTADAADEQASGRSGRRAGNTVSRSTVVHTASQLELALRGLSNQLRQLRVPAEDAPRRDLLVAAARAQLELLENDKKVFLKVRAVARGQQQKLCALDELEMCVMRMRLRSPYEFDLPPGEELYKIFEAEIPVKSTELSADKAVAAAELQNKLGTLRFLQGLKQDQQRRAAALIPRKVGQKDATEEKEEEKTDGAENGGGGGGGKNKPSTTIAHDDDDDDGAPPAADPCPICREPLDREFSMLPCGHSLCYRCQLELVDRIPAAQDESGRRIGCPTCRARVLLSEIAYVDAQAEEVEVMDVDDAADINNGTPTTTGLSPLNHSSLPGEKGIKVKGSYGTKLEAVVRRLLAITRADPTGRVLVFSGWKDALELLSHALTANALQHCYPRTGKKFDAAVAEFRRGHDTQVAAAAVMAAAEEEEEDLDDDDDDDDDDDGAAGPSQRPRMKKKKKKKKTKTKKVSFHAGTTPTTNADDSEAPRILMLLTKQGSNGLNLQQAQHVVFLEPLLDPAEAAQAVGRVDRIGQTRATHVHRFVVQRSIEENVHKLGQHRAAAMDLSAGVGLKKRGKGGGGGGGLTVADVAVLLKEEVGGAMVGGYEMD